MSEPLPLPPPPPPPPPGPAAPGVAPPLKAAQVTGLSCPSCGGTLAVEPGLRAMVCSFCNTPLLITGELGIRRLAVEAEIPQDRAFSATRSWWTRGWNKDPRLKTEATTAEAFLCFLPFFRVEADAVGYAFGTERRTRGSGKNRRTEYVPVERRVERHLDTTFPALNVAEWGVGRVNLTGDRLLPFDRERLERQGMVFSPTASEREVRRNCLAEFEQQADPSAGLHEVHFRYLATLRERLSVIYYPLWVVRYRFRERSYQTVVDAEDGTLAYGKAPGNDLYRAVTGVASLAAACFLFTTVLQWGFVGNSDDSFELVLGAGAAALGLLAWGWRQFRHGGVVEEGTGVARGKGTGGLAGRLAKSFMERR